MSPTPTSQKLQVFFDGACPLCRREARHLQARDSLHRLDWIDIANPNFDPHAFGLDPQRVHQVMHARTPDGRLYTDVSAFIQIWSAVRTPVTSFLLFLLKIPGALPIARLLYHLFARNRYRLTGRCTPEICKPNPPA